MSGLWNQAADGACSQGSYIGHVKPIGFRATPKRCEERGFVYGFWGDALMPTVYLPEPSVSAEL
jgi:hypothetical protein